MDFGWNQARWSGCRFLGFLVPRFFHLWSWMGWHCLKWTWCTIWASSWAHDSCWNSRWLLLLRVSLRLAPVALIPGLEGSWPSIWITAMHSIWYCPWWAFESFSWYRRQLHGLQMVSAIQQCIIFPSGVALVAIVFSDGILDTDTQVLYGIGQSYLKDFFHLFLFIQSCLTGWVCTLGMHWPRHVS